MMKKSVTSLLLLTVLIFAQCGGEASSAVPDPTGDGKKAAGSETVGSPFLASETGDEFGWGKFIRDSYQTTKVTTLPIPVYLAYFTDEEKTAVQEGVDMANQAVGFDVFEVTNTWSNDARVIYKVDLIDFDDPDHFDATHVESIIGYTYSRNIYINNKKEAGRVVTDWAMEVRADSVSKWVVAHELGHAMGIQKHSKIDYDTDSLLPLEPNSLMSAVITAEPVLGDYTEMMQKQGDVLMDYFKQTGASF